jgi:uncharacterized membrane protein YfbV (UPF0208 family)
MKNTPHRDDYNKVYGKDPAWDVFKHNLLKMWCVNLMSKSFFLMVITGTCAMIIIFWTILFSKDPLNWLVYAVLITPPAFFGLWWIEKKRAGELIDAIAIWIGKKK